MNDHPWIVALALGSVATPAGIVLAWLAPRPLDAVVALPLVLVDIAAAPQAGSGAAASTGPVLLLALGIVLTWLLYVLIARLVLWRLVR